MHDNITRLRLTWPAYFTFAKSLIYKAKLSYE